MGLVLRFFSFLLTLSALTGAARAQGPYLRLPHECSAATRPFTTVRLIDKRSHRMVGTLVSHGLVSGRPVLVNVSHEGDLAADIAAYFGAAAPSTDGAPGAVLMLEDFYLGASEGDLGAYTYFKLAVRLFSRTADGRFAEVFSIDTAHVVKGAWAGKVLRAPDDFLCALADSVRRGGLLPLSASRYTPGELEHIDSLEKLSIPAYSAAPPKPGVYRTFEDFKMGTPEDVPLLIKAYPSGLYAAYDTRSNPDWKGRIYAREVYAIVYDGLVLKSTPAGLSKMEFIAGNYFFWAPAMAYTLPFTMMLPHNTRAPGSLVERALLNALSPVLMKRVKHGAWFHRVNHRTGKELIGTLLKGKMED